MKLQDKHKALLESYGFGETKRTGKYIVMHKTGMVTRSGRPVYYYLGKAGAVRKGTTSADSFPIKLKEA